MEVCIFLMPISMWPTEWKSKQATERVRWERDDAGGEENVHKMGNNAENRREWARLCAKRKQYDRKQEINANATLMVWWSLWMLYLLQHP